MRAKWNSTQIQIKEKERNAATLINLEIFIKVKTGIKIQEYKTKQRKRVFYVITLAVFV